MKTITLHILAFLGDEILILIGVLGLAAVFGAFLVGWTGEKWLGWGLWMVFGVPSMGRMYYRKHTTR